MSVLVESGSTVRHYRIIDRLGAGGMGVIYKAEDTKLGRTVALKFLPPELTRDDSAKERFLIEARAASRLDHPNICTVHEIGESEDGQLFISMALYDGETLRDIIARGPVPPAEAAGILKQVARGLAKAHATGIIHRDIKPANIIVTTEGLVKVLDFGLAKLSDASVTKSHTSLGTVAYMSPEQVRGERSTPATDVWGLGVVAYEMLTGRRPFPGDYEQAVIYAILNEEPLQLEHSTAGALAAIVERMLQKDPALRFQSAAEVLAALEGHEVTLPTVPVEAERATAPAPDTRRFVIAAAAILVIVIASLTLVPRHASKVKPEPQQSVVTTAPTAAKVETTAVAVLPFANHSGPGEEYLAEGMQDAIIGELAQFPELRVLSRTSTMAFRDTGKPMPEIASALNARQLVEGSVVRSGDRVMVQVKLIRMDPQERQVWAQSYTRDIRDVLALYSDIAGAVAQQIDSHIQLPPVQTATRQVDPELYKLYLQGMHQIKIGTAESFKTGMALLQKAKEKDPEDALPFAGMAVAYESRAHLTISASPDDLFLARAAAKRALELDKNRAEPYAALAEINLYDDWDWKAAGENFRRALQLNPALALNRRDYAWYLVLERKFDEAMDEARRSRDTDPLNGVYYADMALFLLDTGRVDEALPEARKGAELAPEDPFVLNALAMTYLKKGMSKEALELQRKIATIAPGWDWGLARALVASGNVTEALPIIERLKKTGDGMSAWGLATIYAQMRQKDEALRWAKVARDKHFIWAPWMGSDEPFEILRGDPRFNEILKSMNVS